MIETLAVQVLTGFTAGTLLGLIVKKALNFLLSLAGVYFLSLLALSSLGVITINWAALMSLMQQLLLWLGASTSSLKDMMLTTTPLSLSFVGGVVFGLGFLHSSQPPPHRFVKRRRRR